MPLGILSISRPDSYSILDWKERVIEKDAFAVSAPEKPYEKPRLVEDAQIKFEWRTYIALTNAGCFEVCVKDGFGRRVESQDLVT